MAMTDESEGAINVRDFLLDFCLVLTEDDLGTLQQNLDECIQHEMSITPQIYEELNRQCSVESLKCSEEPKSLQEALKFVPNVDLATVRQHRKQLEMQETDPQFRQWTHLRRRYQRYDTPWVYQLMPAPSKGDLEERLLSGPEVILDITIFRPQQVRRSKPSVDREIRVYGQQSLAEFRDVIACTVDQAFVGEITNNSDLSSTGTAKEFFPSGFFFIENTFYNDMRQTHSIEYSEPILKWASDRGMGEMNKERMEATRFIDLKIRLGHPYLYSHQGDCEHLFMFTDLRVIHPDDSHRALDYPLTISKRSCRRFICRACTQNTTRWIVKGSPLVPEDPCFLCDSCFQQLHYDEHGNKVCNFLAYVIAPFGVDKKILQVNPSRN